MKTYTSVQHDTKYTVTHLFTGGVVYFDQLEQARIYALNCGDCVAIREPRYSNFVYA